MLRLFTHFTQPIPDPALVSYSWAQIKGEGATALFGSENVTSLTDNAAGDYTVTWAVPYAGASSYAVLIGSSATFSGADTHFQAIQTMSASSVRTSFLNRSGGVANDPDFATLIAVGER